MIKRILAVSLLAASACSTTAGGAFLDAVSSVSFARVSGDSANGALSFYRSDRKVRLNSRVGFRPTSDAETSATYTFIESPTDDRAIYRNSDNSFVGFIVNGQEVQQTALADSAQAVNFAATSLYRR